MILPRKNNNWHEDVGIGGTVMVGSVPVEDTQFLEIVTETGLVGILKHIGYAEE